MPDEIVVPAAGGDSNVELDTSTADLDTESLPVEGSEPTDTNPPEPEGEPEGEAEPGTEGSQDGQTPKEDGRVIPQWIRDLKTTNPEGYKKAKAELFELRDRRSVHATPQVAREEHDLVQSLGGREGIAKVQEDVSFLHDAQAQFAKGDPAFTDDLWKEDPIAAALHVAPMLEQYAKNDPDGYASLRAQLWSTELKAVGFVERGLDPLKAAIESGNKEDALAILASIAGWQKSVTDKAATANNPMVQRLLAERAKQHDTKQQTEQTEFLTSYRTEAVNQVVAEGAKVFDSFFKGHKLDKEDRNDLLREALSMANRTVMADKDFATQRDKHLARKDSASALRLTQARYAREFPEAVKRVARRYGMVSGTKPKPTSQQQQPGVARTGTPPAGWTRVNVRPQPEDVNRSSTTNDMILSGKAILKDGRKVDWSHLKKAAVAS